MGLEIPSPAQVGILSTAGVDTLTNGAITASMLEDYIILGLTFGAWTKLFLTISVIVIVLVNVLKIVIQWRQLNKDLHNGKNLD